MIYPATLSELLGYIRSENLLFLHCLSLNPSFVFFTMALQLLSKLAFSKVLLCFHFHFRLSPASLWFFARLFRTRGRWGGDTSYQPPRSDWLPILTRHSCDCFLQRKLLPLVWALCWGMEQQQCVCVCFLSLSVCMCVLRANDGVNKTTCWLLSLLWTNRKTREAVFVVTEGAEWRGVEVSLFTRHWRRLENKVRWITGVSLR